jgi:cation transport regulator ChaB
MKAHGVMGGCPFSPDVLKVLFEAFDSAWSEKFAEDPRRKEAARLNLAHAVLAVASETSSDAGTIKSLVLKGMALNEFGMGE